MRDGRPELYVIKLCVESARVSVAALPDRRFPEADDRRRAQYLLATTSSAAACACSSRMTTRSLPGCGGRIPRTCGSRSRAQVVIKKQAILEFINGSNAAGGFAAAHGAGSRARISSVGEDQGQGFGRSGKKNSMAVHLPGSCFMVAWLRLQKRRSGCCGESGVRCSSSSSYWEQRHRCSGGLLVPLLTRLSTGVLAETEEGVMGSDGFSRW
ncbi:hypothetical protein U9M48_016122 [Paspalum notatum var. saurae]|uniref:Uncharacterized protein n=1 Tax=Paspalum notatum var. saurae TaxID=547442 RepID=A0AAQ3WMI6_PASNO